MFDPESSVALMRSIRSALSNAGMAHQPTTNVDAPSMLRRGQITGLTTATGSTGFSVRPDSDALNFNVVVSGAKAGVDYRPVEKVRRGETVSLMQPLNAEILCPRIADVFEELNFSVRKVQQAPVQLMWDDDIDYAIITDPLPRVPEQEHNLLSEMVELASYATPIDGPVDFDKARTAQAIYFSLRAVPAATLAEHLDKAQVKRLVRRARREAVPGKLEHWLAVSRAQQLT